MFLFQDLVFQRSFVKIQITAPAVSPETLGSRPGSVITGRDREVREATHNWPSVIRVREGLAGREILVSSRTSDSCGGLRANPSLPGARCFLRHIGAAGFRVEWSCVKKQCGLVGLYIGGRMTFNLRFSRARKEVVAMRQDSSY
jgi:hypothetical protein